MGLTVAEKEHWKERISKRIDAKIDKLWAEEPLALETMTEQAKTEAIESLGLTALAEEFREVEQQIQSLGDRKKRLQEQMEATVKNTTPDRVRYSSYYDTEFTANVDTAIARRKQVHLDKLMEAHPIGVQVRQMEKEKDNLLDTVWLATSPSQIKELWAEVSEWLGESTTPLQGKAVAIQPMDE